MPDPLSVSEKPSPRRAGWWLYPLLLCGGVAVLLVAVGDQYPLSPFPMYSNIDTSADMLLIRNENDAILPMSRLFNVGSAQGKKRFESELKEAAGTKEYEEADPEKRRQAGVTFLTKLWAGRDKSDVAKLPQPPQKIRAVIRTIAMDGTDFSDTQTVIAELDVSASSDPDNPTSGISKPEGSAP